MGAEDEVVSAGAPPRQQSTRIRTGDYLKPGQLNVAEHGPDGLPVIVGAGEVQGPDAPLTVEGFICNRAPGREPRRYYRAVLVPAPGVARGFEAMKEIRRFCMHLSIPSELYELSGHVFACLTRDPRDERSARIIEEFENKQRSSATEMAQDADEVEF